MHIVQDGIEVDIVNDFSFIHTEFRKVVAADTEVDWEQIEEILEEHFIKKKNSNQE